MKCSTANANIYKIVFSVAQEPANLSQEFAFFRDNHDEHRRFPGELVDLVRAGKIFSLSSFFKFWSSTTMNCQGCELQAEGARRAASRQSSICSRLIGVSR